MPGAREKTAGERLYEACELHDLGLQMMEARLRRELPDASDAQIEDGLEAWLTERSEADGPFLRVGRWPRRPE
ncbi:MAG: hypothetical protein IT384_27210 [Deltaproteobacteria bacterium]|nr:hypothetical protein [Deltaproteobacteria bacterium]